MGTKGRGIEETIRALRLLDRKFTLDLILFATPQFKLKIEILSRFLGVRRRIKFIAGVPLVQLPAVLNNYDVSIILLSDSIPGHANALPNKFFESIHSKLAVITGPNPSMSKIVTEGDIGISLSSWSYRELAGTVSTLTIEQVQRFKENAAVVAVGLSSDQSRAVFRTLLSKLDYLK
jgi:glycosyltransferase involved in cell wall biosynthesis